MKYELKKYCVAVLIMFFLSNTAQALIYSEADDGRFSNDPSLMTTISFDPGSNTVTGLADNDFQGGADFFSFTLNQGETLTAINLLEYKPFTLGFETPSSFFGIGDFSNAPRRSNGIAGLDPGDENTSLFNASLFTADSLRPKGEPQFNLLDLANRTNVDEANAELTFLDGFTGTLGPGTYWVWLSEHEGEFGYELEFLIDSNVVATPIPASVFLLAGPLGLLLRHRKKSTP